MCGRQLPGTAGKRAYQRRCPTRPAVHRERLVGGVEIVSCPRQNDHEVVEFFILGEVRREPAKLLPWISRGPTLKYSGHW